MGAEHKFNVCEHMFNALEYKFNALEHKNLFTIVTYFFLCCDINCECTLFKYSAFRFAKRKKKRNFVARIGISMSLRTSN